MRQWLSFREYFRRGNAPSHSDRRATLLAACALLGCGIRANRSGPIGVSLDLPAGKGCNAAVGRSTPIVRLRVALAGSVARVLLVRATGCMQLA